MDPQLYKVKRDDFLDTSKNVLPFPYMGMFIWFKYVKNHLRIAIW